MTSVWTTVPIFISSTFQDMNAERDYLVTTVFPELEERAASRHLRLRPIDLRWGVPKEENSVKVCLDIIEKCRPYFVGLLGNRYGSVPPPPHQIETQTFEDIVKGKGGYRTLAQSESELLLHCYRQSELSEHAVLVDGLEDDEQKEILAILERAGMWGAGHSITAMEIFRGVLDDQEQQMISYFYFRDPKVSDGIPASHWDTYNQADPNARKKLEALKRRIIEKGLKHRTYRCRWDSERDSLVDFDEFGKMVLGDLWAAIDSRFPPGHEAGRKPLAEEREAVEYFVQTRTENFVGRRDLLEEMHNFVGDRMREAPDNPGLMVDVGEPGSGKTTLMAQFYREYQEGHPDHAVVGHFLGASASSTDVQALLSRIWSELTAATGIVVDRPAGFRDMVRAFPELLARAAEVRPVCLVVDGLNQLEPTNNAREMRWLPEDLPPRVCVIASTLPGDVFDALSRRSVPPAKLEVSLLTDAEVRELIAKYLKQNLRKLTPTQIDALVEKRSTRNPLYLLVALEELRVIGRFDVLKPQIEGLPDDIFELFKNLLVRLERQHGEALVRDFLSLVAVGRGGQLEEDLRAMLRPEGMPKLPDLDWARLFRSLHFYLLRRSQYVDFFHLQLREAVMQRYLKPEDALQGAHKRTAEHLSERGLDYPRTLTELPYHLDQADMQSELFAVIADPEFRQNKIELTESVAILSTDIDLALRRALASLDLANGAGFGFMNADYNEGRFGKRDVLDLSERDPKAALLETRLFLPRARFRLLVLLALREAADGQQAAAEDLVMEASALRGVELAEGDAEFLRGAVVSLIRSGCLGAAGLLATGFRDVVAAAHVARLAGELESKQQEIVLLGAIEWLRASARRTGVPDDLHLQTFAALASVAAGIPHEQQRGRVLDALEGATEDFTSLATEALERQDVIGFSMGIAFATGRDVFSGTGWWTTGVGAPFAAEAHLGAALVRSGEEDEGYSRIDQAIEGCQQPGLDAGVYHEIVASLRTVPSPQWTTRLTRILMLATRGGGELNLLAILDALTKGPVQPELVEALDVVRSRLERLPVRESTRFARQLALAYAQGGATYRARERGSAVSMPGWQVSFIGRNPLVSARTKIRILQEQLQLAALLEVQRPEWSRRWVQRMARWVPKLDTDKNRAAVLRDLAELSAVFQDRATLEAVLQAAGSITDEERQTKVLVTLLDKLAALSPDGTSVARSAVLDAARRLPREKTRATVLSRWLDDALAEDRTDVEHLVDDADAVRDPAVRADLLGRIAGVFDRWDDTARAQDLWYRAAMADQGIAAEPRTFAARAAAAARSPDDARWNELLDTLPTRDPDVTIELVGVLADACPDARRLKGLERRALKLRWPMYRSSNSAAVRFPIVRAWARIGDPDRAARILLRWLRKERSISAFDEACEIGRTLAHRWGGRALLVRLIPNACPGSNPDPDRIRKLASCFAALPDTWAERAYQQLHLATGEGEFMSAWTKVEARAAIATEMARGGFPSVAGKLLDTIGVPQKDSGESQLLHPQARAAALLEMARAHGAVATAEPYRVETARHTLSEVVEATRDIPAQSFGSQAVGIEVGAWVEATQLGLFDEAARAREAAEMRAAELARGKVSPSSGFEALARGHAGLGDPEQAIAVASRIHKDDANASLLASLVGKFAHSSLRDASKAWETIPTSTGRRSAAQNIARATLHLNGSLGGRDGAGPEPRWAALPPRRLGAIVAVLAALILIFVLPGALYWFAVHEWHSLVDGLTGSHWVWWLLGTVVVGSALARIWKKALRNDIRSTPQRLAVSVAAIPVSPLAGGIYLFVKYLRTRPRVRSILFTVRRRFRERGGPSEPLSYPRLSTQNEALLDLVRMASREAESFDILFGSLVTRASDEAPLSGVLDRLPPLSLPKEIPAQLVEGMKMDRDLRRASRLHRKIAEGVSTVVAKSGLAITAVVVMPATLVRAVWGSRRRKKGYQLGQKAAAILGQGQGEVTMYAASEDVERAVRLYRRATKLIPDDPGVWNDYAIALTQSGRVDEAIAAHEKAIANAAGHPAEAQLWHGLGYTLYQAGRYREGLDVFERALALHGPGTQWSEQAEMGRDMCRSMLEYAE
jgi:hypothetical protein